MLVRLATYERVYRSLRWRAYVLLALGALGVVLSSFVGLLGVLMVIMTNGDFWDKRAGVVLAIFAGVFPFIGSILMLWRGAVGRRRLLRLRDLAALARTRPSLSTADVSQNLSLAPLEAERLVLDAAALGLVEEGEPAIAPAAIPATPRPAASGVVPSAFAARDPNAARQGFDPGAVLNGTYRIDAVIGSGGMGVVYAATHLRTGRRYAVKTLLPGGQISPDAIRRFEREATAASALGHPGIIAVHDFHETERGVHYLVMDLLEGETLEQRLARAGCLVWADARRVALEVGAALDAAHDRGLLHRDLKPANIFLARRSGARDPQSSPSPASSVAAIERAVLLDFGLAKPLSDAGRSRITVSGAAVGTPMYMSPEQARGEAVDVRSDVYGLGAVLYEMITGAPPFLDHTLAGVYAKLLTESAPAASSAARHPCPPAVDALLACALAKRPSDRFRSVRALMGAIESIAPDPAQQSA